MTTAIEHLANLHYSPIILSTLFEEFYFYVSPGRNNILLSYLVLPFYFTPLAKAFFTNAKKSSNLLTYVSKKERLAGLQCKVNDMNYLTNKCIQMSIDNRGLIINKDLSVTLSISAENIIKNNEKNKFIFNMARIISEYDLSTVYKQLGIKKI